MMQRCSFYENHTFTYLNHRYGIEKTKDLTLYCTIYIQLSTSYPLYCTSKFHWMELNLRPGNPNHVTYANGSAPFGGAAPPPYLRLGFDFSICLLTGIGP